MAIVTIGFTGTQKGMSPEQKQQLEDLLWALTSCGTQVELHHGDCIGADAEAHDIARRCQAIVHIHPSRSPLKRAYREGDVMYVEKENLTRNRDIVDAGNLLIAAPDSDVERLRSGTWATVRYARKSGKVVLTLAR